VNFSYLTEDGIREEWSIIIAAAKHSALLPSATWVWR
jgi:hypothetical protein